MENVYNQLICDFLDGKLDRAREGELDLWRKKDAANEKQFQEVKLLWEKSHLAKPMNDEIAIDVNAAFENVKMQLPKSSEKHVLRTSFYRIGIAAAVLLAIATFWVWNTNSTPEILIVQTLDQERTEVTLPDESIVWLNENSTLKYPKSFDQYTRTVTIDGDFIFDVTPNQKKPFIVASDNLIVQVLGTKFNVQSHKDKSQVHVLHGKVSVHKRENKDQALILKKGMSAMLDENSNSIKRLRSFSANDLFWYTKTLSFESESLKTVFEVLEKNYKTQFRVDDATFLTCLFTGEFKSKSIDDILETLQLIYNFEIEKTNTQSILLTQGTCN